MKRVLKMLVILALAGWTAAPAPVLAQDADEVDEATKLLKEGLPLAPERRAAEGLYWQADGAIPARTTTGN